MVCRGTLILALLSCGCGAPSDGDSDSPDEYGSTEQNIYKGNTLSKAQYSSIVQVWPGPGLCSGAMMKNLAVITAKHCVKDYQSHPSDVTVVMGTDGAAGTQYATASQIWVHDTSDVALIRLNSRLATYVFSGGQYVLSYYNYVRPIYTGADSTLHGRSLMLFGYGDDFTCTSHGVARYAGLIGNNSYDGFGLIRCFPNSSGQIGNGGDSGGPLLDGLSPYVSAIAAVQSACWNFQCGVKQPDGCWYETAEAWGGWAYLLLYNIPS